eukprot:gene591-2013_t
MAEETESANLQNLFSFLSDEADFVSQTELMDPATLAAACYANPPDFRRLGNEQPAPEPQGPSPEIIPHPDEDPSGSDADDFNDSKRPRTSNGASANASRSNKADKEKARRCKMNDRFNDLSKLLDLGQETKADKSRVLAEAIKYIQQITVESHQLRQLNKFLEERVAHFERERGAQLYQHSLSMQPVAPPLPHMHPAYPGPTTSIPDHLQAYSHQPTASASYHPSYPPSYTHPPHQQHSHPQQPSVHLGGAYPLPTPPHMLPACKRESYGQVIVGPEMPAPDGTATTLQPAPSPWGSQMFDSTHDSLMRPPAA